MKVLSSLLLTFIFILTGCGNTSSEKDLSVDTSKYLKVSVPSTSSNVPVGIEQYVMLTFSAPIDGATVNASSVYITDENKVSVSSDLTVLKEKISILPNDFFIYDHQYTIVVTTAVEDIEGRTIENTFTFTFLTSSIPDTTAPSLTSVTPADGTSANKATDIIMIFDENIAGSGELQLKDSDSNTVSGISTMSGNTLQFVPNSDLIPGANYTVMLQGNVEDLAGNAYAGITSWGFSVTPLVDTTAPTLISLTPADGTSADKATDIIIAFSEEIANGGAVLKLKNRDTNAAVKGTSTVNNNTMHFMPDSDLIPGANYTVTVLGPVRDLAGNTYEGIRSWDFSVNLLADTTAPELISLTPDDGTSADKTTDIIMAFDEEITNGGAVLKLKNSDTNAVVSGTSTVNNNMMRFVPSSDLIPGANYTVTVLGSVTDLAGNTYTGQTSWDFSVNPLVDMTPPSLTSLTPADGTSADKATNVVMSFDETIADNGAVLEVRDSVNNTIVNGTSTISENTLRFVPDSDLIPGADYTVTLVGTVEDLAGNAYAGITSWGFSVTPLVDTTAPTLISLTPADGTSADKATDIIIAFSEEIAGDATLQLSDSDSSTIIGGTSTISENTLRFVPDSDLIPGADYTVTLVDIVEDLAGNAYIGQTSWGFLVNPLVDTTPPSLTSLTPADGTSADKTTDVVMTFDETIANNGAVLEVRDSVNNTIVNGTSTISENTLRFVPDSDLIPGADYTVTLVDTVEDLAGNAYTGQTSWGFSVIAVSDLSVVSVSHSGRVIRVVFSEPLDPSTVSESDFAINGGSITFDHLIMQNERTVKFISDSKINGTEKISVSGNIKDIYGVSHNNGVTAIYPLGWGI